MQTQPISPYAESPAAGPEHGTEEYMHTDDSPKKKSMMGKVKDKARKLKTKIKKPKSPGGADDNESSGDSGSEDENGSEPQEQKSGEHEYGEERDIVSTPGLQGDALEAIPDPHLSDTQARTPGVEQRFGQMSLEDKSDTKQLQEEVPFAPGVTPYLASHNLGESPNISDVSRSIPVEGGKNAEGKDLLVTPTATDSQENTAMDYEKTPEVSKTSDNTAAWYTPTSEKTPSEEKPLNDPVSEGFVATAGALGVQSDKSDNIENRDANVPREKKGILDQAKERIFGSSPKAEGGEKLETGENKPAITDTATNTATGLKDTIAAKLGYGSNKSSTGEDGEKKLETSENKPATAERTTDTATGLKDTIAAKIGYGSNKISTGEGGDSAAAVAHDPVSKPVSQKIQESTAGATGAVTSSVGEDVATGDKKSYAQKAYDAAYGAKDAVAAKLGYGGTASTENPTAEAEQKSYLQRMQETAVGAKDAVASKFGYTNREVPASTERAYINEQNAPVSTADRFHPGEEDRALSQLITEKMSTGVSTVKDTLLRPFGASKSGPPTPTTTPPPSSGLAVAEDPVHNTVPGTNDMVETAPETVGKEKPGIVGKMTGAVSSLLGTTGSGQKRVDEASSKASEDSQAAGVCNVETH